MLVAVDASQGAGRSVSSDKDRDLQVLLQELCELQAKYERSQAQLWPCPRPSGVLTGLGGWD